MITMKEFLAEELQKRSIEEISRACFPKSWEEREKLLEEALTEFDRPCMSNFQA